MARPDPHFHPDPAHKEEAPGGTTAARGPLIHVATRCTSIDEFVEKFASFASEGALVLPASGELPIGTEGRFAILLRDRSVAMRGRCRVTDAKPAPAGTGGAGVRRTMLRVVLLDMDDATRAVHQRLIASQRPPVPIMVAQAVSERTEVSPPGQELSPPRNVVPPPIVVRPVVPPPIARLAPAPPAPVPAPALAPPAAARVTPQPPARVAPLRTVTPAETPARESTARGPAPPPAVASPRSAPTKSSGTPPAAARPVSPASAYARAPTLIGVPSARSTDGTMTRASQDATVTAVAVPPQETRAPGASFTLPANPLSELGPDDLASFIDCTLFEADDDDAEAIVVDDAGPTVEIDPLAPARPFVIPGGPGAEGWLAPAAPAAAPKKPAARKGFDAEARQLARRYGIPAACLVGGLLLGVIFLRPARVRPPTPAPAPPAAAHAPEQAPAPRVPEIVPEIVPTTPEVVAAPPAPAPHTKVAPAKVALAKVAPAKLAPAKVAPVKVAPTEKPATAAAAALAGRPAAGGGSCLVRVVSEPADAKVLWGSKAIGVTPIESARVPCGTASVTFRRDRWQPVTRDVVAEGNDTTVVSQKLHRPPATLIVGSSPPHAEITVNGSAQGYTPKRIAVSRFESVSIRVALAGYAPWKKTVYVREAETRLGTTLGRADAGKRPAGR